MLPGEAERVKAGRRRHATLPLETALFVLQTWDVDQEWSVLNPVAQTTAPNSEELSSANVTIRRLLCSLRL